MPSTKEDFLSFAEEMPSMKEGFLSSAEEMPSMKEGFLSMWGLKVVVAVAGCGEERKKGVERDLKPCVWRCLSTPLATAVCRTYDVCERHLKVKGIFKGKKAFLKVKRHFKR